MSAINSRVGAILIEKAGMPRRPVGVSPILAQRQRELSDVLLRRNHNEATHPFAMNFFLDHDRARWRQEADEMLERVGKPIAVSKLQPVNTLRGTFRFEGPDGSVEAFFTLTPEQNPLVQELRLRFLPAER